MKTLALILVLSILHQSEVGALTVQRGCARALPPGDGSRAAVYDCDELKEYANSHSLPTACSDVGTTNFACLSKLLSCTPVIDHNASAPVLKMNSTEFKNSYKVFKSDSTYECYDELEAVYACLKDEWGYNTTSPASTTIPHFSLAVAVIFISVLMSF